MLTIAICDDDQYICAEIENMILDYSTYSHTPVDIDVFYKGEEMVEYIRNNTSYDLIFLDIDLDTITGINIGKQIREELDDQVSKIVFISGKTGYERQLFDVQPLNFLDKPIQKEKLIKCIDLVLKILEKEKKFFRYKTGRDFKQVSLKNILYFESKLRKIKIIMQNEVDEFYGTLKNIQTQLPNQFIMVHASYIVNFDYIKKISGETILMNNGEVIPVSKRYYKQLCNLQFQFIQELKHVNL